MTYSLEISLVGADKAESVMSKLAAMSKQLSGGINIFTGGSTSGGVSPMAKQADDVSRLVRQVEQGKVGVHALGRELKNLSSSSAGAVWLSTALGSKSSSFMALNPGLASIVASIVPQSTIKGLRDIGGRDLAKIAAMGTFNDAISKGSIDSQGVPPYLRGPKSGSGINTSSIPIIGKYLSIIGATALAMEAFRKSVEIAKQAINKGFGIYSGAAQSGLSAQFYTQRNSLASIFGVSDPRKIFMFGKAVTDMQQRISGATQILANNAPVMAQIHMNFDVLKLDFEALASDLTAKLVPALNLFMAVLDSIIKNMSGYIKILMALNPSIKMGAMAGLAWMLKPFMDFGLVNPKDIVNFGKQAPALHALMTKLPGSQFEHMGLNIGPGTQTTNDLIRQSNRYLSHLPGIAQALGAGSGGVPRANQFGFLTNQNQP